MGFQNENKLKVGASVKATINNKVVEAKVINIGFNRVTLRSQKGNEATYAFNSDKFLKWFNKVPLTEHMRLHAENKKADILDGIKVVTSGSSVKDRTSTPKEKEDKYKLSFGFRDSDRTSFEIVAEDYTLTDRKSRLGALLTPMFYQGKGHQASAIILTALSCAEGLNKHSDHEWLNMIKNRNAENCFYDTFDNMNLGNLTLFCKLITLYARGDEEAQDLGGIWAEMLPTNKEEALFIAQLLCDGGINKYNLSCGGLTKNLLNDFTPYMGLMDQESLDAFLEEKNKEAEAENLEN
ncbi:hypothetical protein [Helicobacter pylori]|uniref:hypothetical protein n=1 Tax=Helicobacter pylori TaxID=210 RepID=UPI00287B8A8F|nr:hypothetical protein [Helicobacter pylori]WNE32110.1 hypothetical protein RJ559_05580 [Helicobacter pylori]WNE33537.1 hypothetical protein RJ561_05580 [Helicobacter pylori]WNE34965.1 hypothetical protein RJ565_05575 [Helicobacter pylori]WNE36389.1 hypothetical protein RJ564_05585 [Helicobacter pylori]WNE37817.1 hypothetical protein RJ558_05575 [Helicobacter pylori]